MAAHGADAGLTVRGPHVEVVAIGDELLLGDTIDTNGSWLGHRLADEGIIVVRRAVVGDDDAAIHAAVSDALQRTGTVLCCGGLGPTQDDRTRPVIASIYGRPLDVDESWVGIIRGRFEARGMTMPEVNRVQAEVPRGATLLPNDVGTAPGLAIEDETHGITILLPGVPRELRWLTEHRVIPWLAPRLPNRRGRVVRRILRTTGMAESALAERIDDIVRSAEPLTLAFLPTGNGIDLRITSWGVLPDDEANAAIAGIEGRLRERLGRIIYGVDGDDLAAVVGSALREQNLTLAVAESCTGGLAGKRLTDAPGSSDYVLGGVIAYADAIKTDALDVAREVLERHGAVSEEAVAAMVDGVVRRMRSDAGIAITGVAGPGGGSEEKPVGTVWIGARVRDHRETRRLRLFGSRDEVRDRAAQAALKLLLDMLRGDVPPVRPA